MLHGKWRGDVLSFGVKDSKLTLGPVIAVTGGITFIYLLSILVVAPVACILGLLVSAMVATVWMVIRILKDPWSTDKTFDDYFYQDREDIRRDGMRDEGSGGG
jgi:hypothetical protein